MLKTLTFGIAMVNIQISMTPVNPILNSIHFENLDFWGCYGKHTDFQDSSEPYAELNSFWKPWLLGLLWWTYRFSRHLWTLYWTQLILIVNIQIFKTPVNPILNSIHFENLDFWGCYGKHTDFQDSSEPYTELNAFWKPWLFGLLWWTYNQDSSEPYTELNSFWKPWLLGLLW